MHFQAWVYKIKATLSQLPKKADFKGFPAKNVGNIQMLTLINGLNHFNIWIMQHFIVMNYAFSTRDINILTAAKEVNEKSAGTDGSMLLR
jgi:hypothetical protein